MTPDVVVIGAGVLGASIAVHLLARGVRVVVVDRGPAGPSASAGNHGLVWAQDKTPSAYLALTLASIERYPDLVRRLADLTGIDVEYERPGGLAYSLSEDDLAQRAAFIRSQRATAGFAAEMLDASAVRRLEPLVGPEVAGASFCPLDGHLNPLALVRALHAAVARLGGGLRRPFDVVALRSHPGHWTVQGRQGRLHAPVAVLAAGVDLPGLVAPLGLDVPVRPQRGQILASEPLPRLLAHPSVPARQTRQGALLFGATHEEVGRDLRATGEGIRAVAARAIRHFPFVARLALVRCWAALRPLTPDGLPILEQPPEHPGLFLVTSHSGVTLCPAIGEAMATWIVSGARPAWLPRFERERFAATCPAAASGADE